MFLENTVICTVLFKSLQKIQSFYIIFSNSSSQADCPYGRKVLVKIKQFITVVTVLSRNTQGAEERGDEDIHKQKTLLVGGGRQTQITLTVDI